MKLLESREDIEFLGNTFYKKVAKDETIGQGSGPVRHFWLYGIKGR